ncbi:DUF4265 domain-containing protein [Flavobacterium granuli]|uniref:Membrane-bound dolichyl-phosphate-mannose-protein mannosyltransferase n=1 Tax=Flavobacterium granuli TaxID=280093 RepID=A0ABU1S244_9FLAO|nr:DUF4265 domain-containing protein [Flavobacterium granuli]MDR6844235.1 putative membrane-bound dolichyl-phosphate-mannose-protein mannosyltransferase [Flavobacterium granuli]
MAETHAKILFRYHSDVLDEEVVETMWSEIIDLEKGIYKLDSIPFYGPLIATDDIFYAKYDENDEAVVYKETISISGNSIIQVVILKDDYDKEIIREKLKLMDCLSEGLNEKYFVVEIKKDVNYSVVKFFLNEYFESEILDFAEPCLSKKHNDDLLK